MDLHTPSEPKPEKNTMLHALYKAAYWIFEHLINLINFKNGNIPLVAGNGQTDLWTITKKCYEALAGVTVPIATIFFIVAIYKSVISKPAEEQAKQFLMDALRFILVLIVAANLIQILEIVMDISNGMTTALLEEGNMDIKPEVHMEMHGPVSVAVVKKPEAKIAGTIAYEQSAVYKAINALDDPAIFDLLRGKLLLFCEKLFSYILYFIGGLVTVVIFTYSGITIIKVCFQRIVKPLVMIPFSSIVLAIGSCGGEGDRMLWHYGRSFIGYCMSGAMLVVAIRLGIAIGSSNILNIDVEHSDVIVSALGSIISLNLSVLITTGLVSSIESFTSKVFG